MSQDPVIPARWAQLRQFTAARIALGRAGHSLPTAAHLGFQLAHAQARDAVHLPFDAERVQTALAQAGLPSLALHSAAPDRAIYLQRPDLGRRLSAHSRSLLQDWALTQTAPPRFDLAFAVVDGLSALAVHQHAAEVVHATMDRLTADDGPAWRVAPVTVVSQGRVAIGDDIGHALGADLIVVLIGERPGLSSPDSLGAYLTWAPAPGLTDARRNCVSNIRPAGLPLAAGAAKVAQLLRQARRGQLSGVALKDETDDAGMTPLAPPDPNGDARLIR